MFQILKDLRVIDFHLNGTENSPTTQQQMKTFFN